MPNASILDLSTTQLRRAIAIKEQIEALESELSTLLELTQPKSRRRRQRIVDTATSGRLKKRRKVSAAGRARMRAAAKARWAAAKAEGLNKL